MSDNEATFYQVPFQPNDCDYLHFPWWQDLEKELEEYRMCVHLFGGAPLTTCANYALKKMAEDNQQDFDTITVESVKQNFYMDACLRSVTGVAKAVCLMGQVVSYSPEEAFVSLNGYLTQRKYSTLFPKQKEHHQ